jgi:predicted N-formylglutamate amidohydrolase
LPLILSCEHASGRVPPRYAHAFVDEEATAALATHRGFDLGALPLARSLAKTLQAPLFEGRFTRLLVDLNRSPGHKTLLSEWSRRLSEAHIEQLKAAHAAHWEAVLERIGSTKGRVTHLAIHTFTPVLGDDVRNFDVGLLYDPRKEREVDLANRLRLELLERGFLVRRNAPYRGVADCLPTAIRRRFPPARYAGLELEVNQRLVWHAPEPERQEQLFHGLCAVLHAEQRARGR